MILERYNKIIPQDMLSNDPIQHNFTFNSGSGVVQLRFASEREVPVIEVKNGQIVMIGRSGIGPLWRDPSTMKPSDMMTEAERCMDRYGEIMTYLGIDYPSKNFEPLIRFAMDKRDEFRRQE